MHQQASSNPSDGAASQSEPSGARRLVIISGQAFSLYNFRGPLIRDIVARGWEVRAIAPDYDGEVRAAVRSLGATPVDCRLSRTGINPLADVLDCVRMVLLLRKMKADAVIAYSAKPVIYGTLAAWMAGIPRRYALVTGLGYAFTTSVDEENLRKKRWLRAFVSWLYKIALAKADVVFFHNRDDLAEFVEMGLVERARARSTHGTGIDLREWPPAPAVTTPITFLLVGRMLHHKGVVEYVEAARRIKATHPEVRFLLLGGLDSNPSAISETQVVAWVNENIVEWPGHVPVRPWLAQASVFVLPSYYREGLPRSTQEAMAMARPVITTDAVGCRDTTVDGENGFLVPVRDVDALEAAMRRFIVEPALIEPMGLASRRLAEQRFDVRLINASMLESMGI
ncbi:MAG: glycosyltransferase family 4 protein [Rhodospirillaceae bacterium]|nr:glycosyltransferase family 4 protein [Rhodospirillaceae bacterium]